MSALSFADLLRTVWPRNTAKAAARAAHVSHRTSGKWLYEGATPSADTLIKMISESGELREELLRRLGDAGYDGKEYKSTRRAVAPSSVGLGGQAHRSHRSAAAAAAAATYAVRRAA